MATIFGMDRFHIFATLRIEIFRFMQPAQSLEARKHIFHHRPFVKPCPAFPGDAAQGLRHLRLHMFRANRQGFTAW